jgi:sulfide dehydrogenase [flavocytochrome c] flavoprotein subunit
VNHIVKRRDVLKLAGAACVLASAGISGCATVRGGRPEAARVLVVGGGFGGATAAKYVRLLSQYKIDVVLIEPDAAFVSCPMSNLVVSGSRTMADITRPYQTLSSMHGVSVVRDSVERIDATQRVVTLASGGTVRYDKMVLAPGVGMIWEDVPGLREANLQGRILHAYKGGSETTQLRQQLQDMPDGGVFAIAIPEMPYRCPPAPYERASLIANYFKTAKPRSKVLILDANEDVTSEGSLFKKAWSQRYGAILEYRPQHKVTGVDAATNTLKFEIQDDVRADVLNVLPPMRAGDIAVRSGLANSNARWCNVNFLDFESTAARNIHVIGDAIQIAPAMPKSGHMANGHAKVVAAALVAQLNGWETDPSPMLTSSCYSFVDELRVMHVCTVHQYVAADKTYKTVPGSGGLSSAANEAEAGFAYSWARSIWTDMLA